MSEYSLEALIDALDDLADGIEYVREIAEGLLYGFDDLIEEEDISEPEAEKEVEDTPEQAPEEGIGEK